MRCLTLAVLSLAFLVACQAATTELTEEQQAEIVAEVNAANAEFWSAAAEVDFDRLMAQLHNSPETVWGFGGELDHGWDAIYAKYSPLFESLASQTMTITESQTTVVTPDVVCINEVATGFGTDTAGVAGPETTYAILTVWVRRGGEWKALFGHESVLAPDAM